MLVEININTDDREKFITSLALFLEKIDHNATLTYTEKKTVPVKALQDDIEYIDPTENNVENILLEKMKTKGRKKTTTNKKVDEVMADPNIEFSRG